MCTLDVDCDDGEMATPSADRPIVVVCCFFYIETPTVIIELSII